jgi:Domain of unknown function (DUF932)
MNNPIEQTGNFNRTERYKHIQTSDIVEKFASMGYKVTATSQVKTRKIEKQGFQKHLLRFANENQSLVNVMDSRPEIVLINSHDGSTGYELMLGIYRLVCANGLIVGNTFGGVRFRHSGDDVMSRVEKAVEEIQTEIPRISAKINEFSAIQMNESKQKEYAEQAVKLIVPKTGYNVSLDSALTVRRSADQENNLWTVYNRLQESLLRGGISYNTRNVNPLTNEISIRNATGRAVKGIGRNIEINRSLWDLTEEFAKVA